MKAFQSASTKETKELAKKLALRFTKKSSRSEALVLALQGELGSGKTTFVQGFARAVGVREKLLSPTFLIVKKYKIPRRQHYTVLYHVDCYRLEKPQELLSLGWKEILSNPKALVLLEWPERVRRILPQHAVSIKFAHEGQTKRRIILS